MSFQAYLDTIKAKTGKTPEDFIALAEKKGFLKGEVKAGPVVAWLKEDFGLGQGHAMAIVLVLRGVNAPETTTDDEIAKHFTDGKAGWRKPYDGLLAKLGKLGPDVTVSPTSTYISLLRGKKKFGIVQITADRMDVGIKLKGAKAAGRLEDSGKWNAMVTHRVRVTDAKQLDSELLAWLKQAYENA